MTRQIGERWEGWKIEPGKSAEHDISTCTYRSNNHRINKNHKKRNTRTTRLYFAALDTNRIIQVLA